MGKGLNQLTERKALLVVRCNTDRLVLAGTVHELQRSMSWLDIGYSVAAMFAPKLKMLLPALALAAGSRLGGTGKVGGLISKAIAGWQLVSKARSLWTTFDLGSMFRKKSAS